MSKKRYIGVFDGLLYCGQCNKDKMHSIMNSGLIYYHCKRHNSAVDEHADRSYLTDNTLREFVGEECKKLGVDYYALISDRRLLKKFISTVYYKLIGTGKKITAQYNDGLDKDALQEMLNKQDTPLIEPNQSISLFDGVITCIACRDFYVQTIQNDKVFYCCINHSDTSFHENQSYMPKKIIVNAIKFACDKFNVTYNNVIQDNNHVQLFVKSVFDTFEGKGDFLETKISSTPDRNVISKLRYPIAEPLNEPGPYKENKAPRLSDIILQVQTLRDTISTIQSSICDLQDKLYTEKREREVTEKLLDHLLEYCVQFKSYINKQFFLLFLCHFFIGMIYLGLLWFH